MFNIEMLPADHGDCLWVEYGADAERARRILIDGGTQHSFDFLARRIENFPADTLDFELFVITHVDADHIGGSLELLRNLDHLKKRIIFRDIWFNGWKHLSDELGDMQGEFVTDHLESRRMPWNEAFDGKAVIVPDTGNLPSQVLPGGLRLTLLSPNRRKLDKLRDRWEETITKAGKILGKVKDEKTRGVPPSDLLGDDVPDVSLLAAKRSTTDKTPANGSSIAFLAECASGEGSEKRCLFTGDAHPDLLVASVKRLIDEDARRSRNGRLQIDALKISHHGSKKNVSKELLELLDCPKFLFSTNGRQFKHPDLEAVARVIQYGKTPDGATDPKLYFNYKSKYNRMWDDAGLQFRNGFEVEYPTSDDSGIIIRL